MKRLAERVYAAVLWCYPPAFRRAHGLEMRQFARTALALGRGRGVLWMLAADTVRGLLREWTATLRGEHMRNLARDVQQGARLLLRSPAFTAAAVITLALGIGANTAMFTLADSTLLRPLQVRDAERMVVWSWTSSYPDYQEYTKHTDVFDGVAAVAGGGRLSFAIDGHAELAQSVFVSGNAFDVLGVRAAHGRTILPSDDVANGPLIAVLGYDYWRSRFGSDPSVVGRTFRVNGRPIGIVGVLEKGFRGTSLSVNPAFYLPTGVYNQVQTGFFSRVNALTTRGFVWLNVIGRLRPGTTATQAAATMTGVYAQMHPPKPGDKTEELVLETLPTRSLGRNAASVKNFVTLLLGVVALTLLIGCANLANLLLAKAATRRREIGVRLALGATRGRVVRQMLAESMLLAGVGGAAGIGVAALALQALSKYQLPGGIAIENMRLEIHGVALAATLGLSVLTGLLFGAFPAWRASRTDVLVSLRDESRGSTARSGIRSALLGAQIALSLVLLAGTGLFARSLMSGLRTPLGFDERDVITASVNLGFARYEEARAEAFFVAALERVLALSQIESAAWGNLVPTRGVMLSQTEIEGYSPQTGETPTIYGAHVGPGYFHTIGTRLLTGREIADDDRPSSPAVAVINDAMAGKYWSGRNPIGGRFLMFKQWITVVGVVENTVVRELGEKPVPHMYLAFDQWISGPQGIAMDPAHLFVRSRVGTASAMPLVRDQLRALDPELPLYDIEPFEDRVRALVMPQRMGVVLFALFSTLAVALATVGIYGVSTYVAALRTREIGVRIALGASRTAVRRLILLDGAKPVALGIAVGLAIALFASRLVRAFLLDISPFDPLTFTGVTVLLAVVALAASYLPARRASRIEPVAALRSE